MTPHLETSTSIDPPLARDVVEAVRDAMFWRGPVDGGNHDAPIWRDQALELVHPNVADVYRREYMDRDYGTASDECCGSTE